MGQLAPYAARTLQWTKSAALNAAQASYGGLSTAALGLLAPYAALNAAEASYVGSSTAALGLLAPFGPLALLGLLATSVLAAAHPLAFAFVKVYGDPSAPSDFLLLPLAATLAGCACLKFAHYLLAAASVTDYQVRKLTHG